MTTQTTTAPAAIDEATLRRHTALGDTFAVLRTALRLLGRHWPVLIALSLAGFAARHALLMASVKASDLNRFLAVFVFALVPASMLVSMLLMMQVVRSSLPDLMPIGKSGDRDALFLHIASVFVPFLAVYAAYDFIDEDRRNFYYGVWFDAASQGFATGDLSLMDTSSRLPTGASLTMAVVIGAAILARTLFGAVTRRAKGNLAVGIARSYLEATWVSLTALSLNGIGNDIYFWLLDRRLWVWVDDAAHTVASWFGPFSPAAQWVVEWFEGILGSIDSVFLIPVAWLTIGCIIYGRELVSPPRAESVEVRRTRLSRVVRAVVTPIRNGVDDRFGPMVRGFRMLKLAGLRTMLLFCLAFVVAQALPEWLWELERVIIGSQDLNAVWVPLSGPLSSVNETFGLVATICLVSAAVDHVLRVSPPPPPPPTEPASPPADAQPEVAGKLGWPTYLYGDGLDSGGREEKNRGGVVT